MDNHPVHGLLRRTMRQIREEHAKSLEDVAQAARELRINWDASVVSRTENGHRQLTLTEFLNIDTIMSVACDDVVLLSDLLPCEADDAETRSLLEDIVVKLATPYAAVADPQDRTLVRAAAQKLLKIRMEVLDEHRETPSEELRRLADEFGVLNSHVAQAIVALNERGQWQHLNLRSERERRLANEDLSDPARAKGLRVSQTRQLKNEIRDELAAKKGSRGQHHESAERVARKVADTGRR